MIWKHLSLPDFKIRSSVVSELINGRFWDAKGVLFVVFLLHNQSIDVLKYFQGFKCEKLFVEKKSRYSIPNATIYKKMAPSITLVNLCLHHISDFKLSSGWAPTNVIYSIDKKVGPFFFSPQPLLRGIDARMYFSSNTL